MPPCSCNYYVSSREPKFESLSVIAKATRLLAPPRSLDIRVSRLESFDLPYADTDIRQGRGHAEHETTPAGQFLAPVVNLKIDAHCSNFPMFHQSNWVGVAG